MNRNASLDHLRVALTALVIFHHTAIVYGGSGGWYWRELPNASDRILLLFNATNQAHFMGFFFLLAGYFTVSSYERKGAGRYLIDRFVRLGIPLLFYFFLLAPFTIAVARTHDGIPLWSGWLDMIHAHEFGPGPLWFAETLLLFACGYVVWRKIVPEPAGQASTLPSFVTLTFIAIGLGAISFLVRLVVPVGHEVLWLQLGYFPCYIFLFIAGCLARPALLLENITLVQARPWMITSALTILILPVFMIFKLGHGDFSGGWSTNALFYAFWDPLVAWGAILGSLWAAKTYWSRDTAFSRWLSQNAFGAFIVHPPVVVALSLLASTWSAPGLLKFALVGAAASAGSFLIGGALRQIPGAQKIL